MISEEEFLNRYDIQKLEDDVCINSFDLGIGTHIIDFIKLYFLEDNKTGCRFITVDAYNAAVPFYEKNGFRFLQQREDSPTQLMYFDLMNVIDG